MFLPKSNKMSDSTFSAFISVLTYSIFILVAPITTFFVTKLIIFQGIFNTDTVTTNVWSAVAAIIVLHIALGLYIYTAYGDAGKVKPDKPTKAD